MSSAKHPWEGNIIWPNNVSGLKEFSRRKFKILLGKREKLVKSLIKRSHTFYDTFGKVKKKYFMIYFTKKR